MTGKLIKLVEDALCILGIVSGMFYVMLVLCAPLPQIHISGETGDCIKMVSGEGEDLPCPKELPRKHDEIKVYGETK